jgi:hypothetical protein
MLAGIAFENFGSMHYHTVFYRIYPWPDGDVFAPENSDKEQRR